MGTQGLGLHLANARVGFGLRGDRGGRAFGGTQGLALPFQEDSGTVCPVWQLLFPCRLGSGGPGAQPAALRGWKQRCSRAVPRSHIAAPRTYAVLRNAAAQRCAAVPCHRATPRSRAVQLCSCATQPRGTMLPCHALPCSHAMSPCHAGWPCRTAVPCSHAVGGTGGQVERGGGRADLPRGHGSCGCLGWGVLGCHWERRRLRKPAAPSVCCRGCRQGWVEGEPLVWGAGGVVAFLAPGRFAGSCPPDFPSTWVCLGPPVPALCVRVTPKSPGSQVT